MECPICDNELIIKKVPYSYNGTYFGMFEAYHCDSCEESYIREKHLQAIENFAKQRGLWGPGIFPHLDVSSSDSFNQSNIEISQLFNRIETKPYKVISIIS